MLQTHAPQYGMTASGTRTTRFGAIVQDIQPPVGRNVVQIDALYGLCDIWGSSILEHRQSLYQMVSGEVNTDAQFQELLTSYYTTYPGFANFVDEQYLFGDMESPLVVRIIEPARKAIQDEIDRVKQLGAVYGGTCLGVSNDYVYLAFEGDCPAVLKERVVC